MKANAWHHRADAVSSLVALIGVGGAIVGIPFLDPLAGVLVSGMILRAGIESGHQSVMELVDAGVPTTLLAPIKQTILQVDGIKGCHHLRGRKAGSKLYLDVHIEVEPSLSVSTAHHICKTVQHQIHKFHDNVAEIHIEIDPAATGTPVSVFGDGKASMEVEGLNDASIYIKKYDVENLVSNIISTKFPAMSIERISPHIIQGNLFLEVQVLMPYSMMIQDAMFMAKDAEEEILKLDSNIVQASILLRLGNKILKV